MPRKLLALLSDGHVHSGESLGVSLDLSRAAVWKQIQRLQNFGISVTRIKGHGYKLDSPLELMQADKILSALDPTSFRLLSRLDIKWTIPSTNSACLDLINAGLFESGHVCLAEHQSAGRGRRGRKWISPLASNVYMSVIWKFTGGIESLEGLSLAVGICIADALKDALGLVHVQLKWPNDILCGGKKLGGILIDVAGDAVGPCYAVIGLGLNIKLPHGDLMTDIKQPFTDLCRELLVGAVSRNIVVPLLLNRLLPMLRDYEQYGFKNFPQQWRCYDAFFDKEVIVHQGVNECVAGVAKGVSDSGSLLVCINNSVRQFRTGEVSLRHG
jgi:BirA family biotin operon repressor/biotin-[acetyl-CoA-carboxylase] ligase